MNTGLGRCRCTKPSLYARLADAIDNVIMRAHNCNRLAQTTNKIQGGEIFKNLAAKMRRRKDSAPRVTECHQYKFNSRYKSQSQMSCCRTLMGLSNVILACYDFITLGEYARVQSRMTSCSILYAIGRNFRLYIIPIRSFTSVF